MAKRTTLGGNNFEMTGRITFVDIKYAQNGNAYARVLMSKKNPKEDSEYDTYAFTFFGKTAEEFSEVIKKGDTANITGFIAVDKFEKDGKTIEKLSLIGTQFLKAEYSEADKGYVEAAGDSVPWK